ncbi:MAG TPA: hypothetical protein VMH04_17075 [Candidatus Solibacter sp.]|nr:hypothetical protein [Candidatus Solibacter sp.]
MDPEILLSDTALKLEKMADASSGGKSFTELQPMIDQLRQTWAELDAGLASLPRQEAKLLRRAHQARMGAAAATLCKNVLQAKMLALASGQFSPPAIAMKADTLADRFAVAIVQGDYDGARALLASWLQPKWTAETLRERVQRDCAAIAEGFDLASPPPLADYEIGSNSSGIADLRQHESTDDPIPAEISDNNFVAWIPITIMPSEEDSYLTDIGVMLAPFVIVVNENGKQKLGYIRFGEG